MPSKLWDELTYQFSNFNGATVEIWECHISTCNFVPHFIMDIITYPCWSCSYSMLINETKIINIMWTVLLSGHITVATGKLDPSWLKICRYWFNDVLDLTPSGRGIDCSITPQCPDKPMFDWPFYAIKPWYGNAFCVYGPLWRESTPNKGFAVFFVVKC